MTEPRRVDFEPTGKSDLPWPAGNPPAGSYRVIGTHGAPRLHRVTGGAHQITYQLTVRDHDGREQNAHVVRHPNQPRPRVGQDLTGTLTATAFGNRLDETAAARTPSFRETNSQSSSKEDPLKLPDKKTSRQGRDPRDARVLLSSPPKIGKTTLLSQWAPDTTLILDTHKGTALLDGEHYVQAIDTFQAFEQAADQIAAGAHQFRTIGIDLIEDVYTLALRASADRHGKIAAASVEFGKGTGEALATFTRAVDKLLATPYGIWFISHVDTVQDKDELRYIPRLDKRIKSYIEGATDFVLIGETGSARQGRMLRTAPTARFQAGSRVPLPDPMPLDARALYVEIAKGLGKPAAATPAPATASPEAVAA